MINYILPHLGMGDYIVCNGLIRNLIKRNPKGEFILFTSSKLVNSIKFMFRDISNLSYSIIPPVEFNRNYILPYIKHKDYHLIIIGYDDLDKSMSSDKSFYHQFGLNFEKRWTDFYVERDLKREKEFFNKFDLISREYIFIHDDPSRNQIVDKNIIKNKNLKIIEAKKGLTSNIFDYCYIIENAAEIHCIESSFLFLSDSIPTNGKLFSHRYARELYDYTIPNMKKTWTIIK